MSKQVNSEIWIQVKHHPSDPWRDVEKISEDDYSDDSAWVRQINEDNRVRQLEQRWRIVSRIASVEEVVMQS